MDPPLTPLLTANTESIASSPHSHETDSLAAQLPAIPNPSKICFMCSHGGRIVTRPYDASLCYVGGDTRIIFVDRNIMFADLVSRIAKTLGLVKKGFSLMYKMPHEDFDALVSLFGDKDVEVMIDEYDRCKESRLRLFVFEVKSESICLPVGSRLLKGGFSGLSSVDKKNKELDILIGKSVKGSNQDIRSVSHFDNLETTSLFGSMNLITGKANLPPIRVRESGGDQLHDRISVSAGDCYGEMPSTCSSQSKVNSSAQHTQAGDKSASRVVSGDEKSYHCVGAGVSKKPLQAQVPQQQQKMASSAVGLPKPDLISSDGFAGKPNVNLRSDQMACREVLQVSSGESRTSNNHVDQTQNLDAINVHVQLRMPDCGYKVQPNIEWDQQAHHYSYPQQSVRDVIQQPGNPMPIPAFYPLSPPLQQAFRPHHQYIQLQQPLYRMYIVLAPQPQQGYSSAIQQAIYHEITPAVHTGLPQTVLPIPNSAPDGANAVSVYPNTPAAAFPNPEPACAANAFYGTTSAGDQHMGQKQFGNYVQANHQPHTVAVPAPTSAHIYEVQDPVGSQICFTQPPSPLLVSQYQSMPSSQPQVLEASDQPQNYSVNPLQVKNL